MKLTRIIPLILVMVLAPALTPVQARTKKPYKLPAVFNMARFVWVEAEDGQQFDPRLLPEDREAIGDVYNALENWHRYMIVVQRDQADLIFVVRKGRLVTAGVGVQTGSGPVGVPGGPTGGPVSRNGIELDGEVGSPDDLLEVYERNPGGAEKNPGDAGGTLLWRHTLADGLNAPEIPLFKQLKEEVDRDYPKQTASNQKKP